MSGTDKIHETQEKVAKLQSQLDGVQRMLDSAEKIAVAGEAAQKRATRLLGASIAVIVIGILLLVRAGEKRRED